jgi:hypothetical protein
MSWLRPPAAAGKERAMTVRVTAQIVDTNTNQIIAILIGL